MTTDDFQMHFRNGRTALDRGRTTAALGYFANAAAAITPAIHPETEQHRGICLRMLGRLDEASAAFKAAVCATTPEQRVLCGNIWCDWSMVPFEEGDLLKAGTMIEKSLGLLQVPDEPLPPEDEAERRRSYWRSLGFRARIDAAHGERAPITFKQVRLAQKGQAPDELNTIAWEMKSLWWLPRWKLLPHALKLSFQARNIKRVAQVVLLAFAKSFAKKLEKKSQHNFGAVKPAK